MTRLRRLDLGRVAILALLVVGTAALLTRDQWDWVFEDGSIRSEAPIAPTIDDLDLSLIHISEPTRPFTLSRMPSSA